MRAKSHGADSAVKIALIGAGVRGVSLAGHAASSVHNGVVAAVAEPSPERREKFAREFGLGDSARFSSWEDLMRSPAPFDAAIIATMDNQHTGPALACLRRGCHALIEKPLSDTPEGCAAIARLQTETGLVAAVCHTLRYLEPFRAIKKITAGGTLGSLIHIEHMEAIGHLRFSHNYVRGRWAREADNTFLLLHKSCHDIDLIAWLADEPCRRVSSFGSLSFFKPENAPPGSAARCAECPLSKTCFYSAFRLYADNDLTGRLRDLGPANSPAARLDALRDGPFGVCVWKAGNDVVDHQTVGMEFESGLTASCAMSGFSGAHGRRCALQGTKGELRFDETEGSILLREFARERPEIIRVPPSQGYHPEDKEIVDNWLSAVRRKDPGSVAVDAHEAGRTLRIVFGAERSRREKITVCL